jgi:hypothetical protein
MANFVPMALIYSWLAEKTQSGGRFSRGLEQVLVSQWYAFYQYQKSITMNADTSREPPEGPRKAGGLGGGAPKKFFWFFKSETVTFCAELF